MVLGSHPHLRCCLKRCRHCRIFFLTDLRNAGRDDLGCPFGCRDAHRRRKSIERSVAYYRTAGGRTKRQKLNERRAWGASKRSTGAAAGPVSAAEAEGTKAVGKGGGFDVGMVEHVRVVTSLVEGRRVSRAEILAMLARILRQHSTARMRRIDYVIARLAQSPSG